ncbi:MAG: succinate dehydrogenase [Simkaniaceae bacterium]|nr:succinate dehydrogenase [Simkaniaceae bacterium]
MDRTFFWRKIHSLFGLWFTLFLLEHLFTNSQAALLPDGEWNHFVRAVNFIHNIPYLHAVEVLLLGIPILFHAGLGVRYALTGKINSLPSNGSRPSLPQYGRNQAYTWQRWTSWILLLGLLLHVGYMRFYRYPTEVHVGNEIAYTVNIEHKNGIDRLSKELGVSLIEQNGKLIAQVPEFGTATLLVVRDAFLSPFKCVLYTIFVLAACFHAFNGLWTFMISWGIILRVKSQQKMSYFCTGLMGILIFLGLSAIWGSYWSFQI